MDFASRHRAGSGAAQRASSHRCPQCRVEALVLTRRHVSPPRLGDPLVTEYYECNYCDSRFQYSPASDKWKPLA
jgi:hypothetical protein